MKTSIKELIRNNLSIPTLPEVVMRINRLVDDPDVGTAEIGELVSHDAPLAAKVLRIANSAYYGLSGECVSTAHASTVLGIKVLRNIVTQVAVINEFDHLEDSEVFSMQELWNHACLTGHLCSRLGQRSSEVTTLEPEEFYVCGLLHDVGKVILLDGLGEQYRDIVSVAAREQKPLHLVERAVLSFNHTDVGSVVANRWGLPEQISNAIHYHHGPRDEVASNEVVSVVAHANLLAHRVVRNDAEGVWGIFDVGTREQLGLCQEDVADVVEFAFSNRGVTAS